MKKLILLFLLIPSLLWAAPPARIYTYTAGEPINPEHVTANEDVILNYLNRDIEEIADNSVTSAKIVDGTILNADIATNAAIAYSKLSLVDSIGAGDIASTAVSAGSYTNTDLTVDADGRITTASNGTVALASEVSGTLPVANGGTGTTSTTFCNLTTNVTGTLPVGNGGTGATAAANAANGVVVLNASTQLPAVSGALLTNVPGGMTQVNDTDAGTTFTTETTVLSVAKTITSGKTVLLIATGYLSEAAGGANQNVTIILKQGSTTVQSIATLLAESGRTAWAVSGIVTGLSGNITFSVTMASGTEHTGYGNLEVLEF